MKKIRIGGVPEHFNFPWYVGISSGRFTQVGLDIEWKDVPEGTGTMSKMLRENTLDAAVILTAGIAVDILKGNPARIMQGFVKSRLIWGIHTRPGFLWEGYQSLAKGRIAISRKGSGSHFFPLMIADECKIDKEALQFVEIATLEGAKNAFDENRADIFLWEKFMTEPLVQAGSMNFSGEWIAPWSAFVLAVNEDFAQKNRRDIRNMQTTINLLCRSWMANKAAAAMVAEKFHLDKQEAQKWFEQTKWCTSQKIISSELAFMLDKLFHTGFINIPMNPKDICSREALLLHL